MEVLDGVVRFEQGEWAVVEFSLQLFIDRRRSNGLPPSPMVAAMHAEAAGGAALDRRRDLAKDRAYTQAETSVGVCVEQPLVMLSVMDVSQIANRTPQAVTDAIRRGRLHARKMAGRWRIDALDAARYIQERSA